jgi:Leucine-rich repeat (LRR) protein
MNLNLSNNQISEIISLENGNKSYFKNLELENNSLLNFCGHSKNSVSCFVGCQLLENIDLSHNKLNSIVFDNLSVLKNLRTVNLADNKIEELINSGSSQIHVEYLILTNNKLREIKAKSFINSKKTKEF